LGRAPAVTPATYPFLAPPEAPDELGRPGPYRIKDVLGEGGMATVLDAEARVGNLALPVFWPHRHCCLRGDSFACKARVCYSN
jgi:hypothetical protein